MKARSVIQDLIAGYDWLQANTLDKPLSLFAKQAVLAAIAHRISTEYGAMERVSEADHWKHIEDGHTARYLAEILLVNRQGD